MGQLAVEPGLHCLLPLGEAAQEGGSVMHEFIQVLTTTASREDAQLIADALVEQRLAGCVQIVGPIYSTFWWRGKIERSEEWFCIIKSEKGLYHDLEHTIKVHHPYEIPEIIAVPMVAGSQPYLQWLGQELRQP
jgi:periplasmic divalent cation tolerance protein